MSFYLWLKNLLEHDAPQDDRNLCGKSADERFLTKPKFTMLSTEEVDTLRDDAWMQNPAIHELLKEQDEETIRKITNAIKLGYVNGETNSQIKQRVDKYIKREKDITSYSSESVARTMSLSIANQARLQMYKSNADIIGALRWLATLDMRTCIRCAARDGKYWDLDGQPIGHNIPFEMPPIHANCRCTIVGVLSAFSEIEDGQVIETKAVGQRASMNGPVSARWDFSTWLSHQSKEDQIQYIGLSRFILMKRGDIVFSDLIDQNGNIRTISELGHPEMPDDLPSQDKSTPQKSKRKHRAAKMANK